MINIRENINKKNIAIVLFVLILLITGQAIVIKHVQNISSENNVLKTDTYTLNTALKRKSNAIAQYKSVLNFDSAKLPSLFKSPTTLYTEIVNIMTESGLTAPNIQKIKENNDEILFKVNGKGAYYTLLNTLLAFRKGHLIKLSDLTITANSDNDVNYSFTLIGKLGKE